MAREKSRSVPQARAEKEMVEKFGNQLGVALRAEQISLPDGAQVQIDGHYASNKRRVLVEASARTKQLLAGQKRKVLTDILKLIYVSETLLGGEPDLVIDRYLLFHSESAASFFRGDSWATRACSLFGVKVLVLPTSEATFREVQQAELEQNLLNDLTR